MANARNELRPAEEEAIEEEELASGEIERNFLNSLPIDQVEFIMAIYGFLNADTDKFHSLYQTILNHAQRGAALQNEPFSYAKATATFNKMYASPDARNKYLAAREPLKDNKDNTPRPH